MQNDVLVKFFMHDSKTGNFYTFVITNNQSLISQALKLVDPDPKGANFEFFQYLGT